MFRLFKNKFYFLVAGYFKFFAKLKLSAWKPRIVVVTGSSGKTTLLHLLEYKLGSRAKYSHHANSSFGIPFDILGLKRSSLMLTEWVYLVLAAPFKAFSKPYSESIYIVEADCDRPGEGKFLANLLRPELVLWTNSSGTHSMNFDKLVRTKKFKNVEEAIAHEFGYFLEVASGLSVVNGDDANINSQIPRAKAEVKSIKKQEHLQGYKIFENGTEFVVQNQNFIFNCLLPEEVFYSVAQIAEALKYLGVPFDTEFKNFVLPPGRASVFQGFKNTTIIDSSYNATLDGMRAMLAMFKAHPAQQRWAVIGDMLEMGEQEQAGHEALAEILANSNLTKIILMGPRVSKYTFPKLQNSGAVAFEKPKQALDFLQQNLQGGETVLFKGARFLEGVIEHLLANKEDAKKLCRREKVWQLRRKEWGL